MFARVFSLAIALMVSLAADQRILTAGQAPERGAQDPGARGDAGRGARGGGLANKTPDLPAGAFTASSTVAHTTLQHEWVDIASGGARLHTWIEYPAGSGRRPLLSSCRTKQDWTIGCVRSPINWRATASSLSLPTSSRDVDQTEATWRRSSLPRIWSRRSPNYPKKKLSGAIKLRGIMH